MKKILIGMVLGAAIAAGLFIPLLFREGQAKFDCGQHRGQIAGLTETAVILDKEFGKYDGKSEYKMLFSIKDTDGVVIETNGVKTVRVIR